MVLDPPCRTPKITRLEIVHCSEHHFQCELNDTWRSDRVYHSEVAVYIAAGCIKLSVIKGVEELTSELHARSFRNLGVLLNGNIPVVDAGSMKESPRRRAELAQRFLTE